MFIEINLLTRGFRPKKRLFSINNKFIFTLLIIIAAVGLAVYYIRVQQSLSDIQQNLVIMRTTESKMQSIIALNQEVNQLKEDIEKRINIIKELTEDSGIRYNMLEHINGIIPEDLRLMNIDESNRGNDISFTIEGISFSKDRISSFLSGLEQFERFSNVSLESITPAPLETRDALNFIIQVELISSQSSQEPEE